MLVHGLCSSPLEMQYVGRRMAKAGFAVSIPYLHGYGCDISKPGRQVRGWEAWLTELTNHFDLLKTRYRSVSVTGLCMGATLALGLAGERGDEIAALSLLSTTLFYDGWNVSPFRFLLPIAYHTPLGIFYRKHRERPPYGLKNLRLRHWIEQGMKERDVSSVGAASIPTRGLYQAERLISHVKGILPKIGAPTLLIHATEDDVSSVRSPDFVEKHIGASHVEQLRLDNSYHMITVDNEKEIVAQRSISFFRDALRRQSMETNRDGSTEKIAGDRPRQSFPPGT